MPSEPPADEPADELASDKPAAALPPASSDPLVPPAAAEPGGATAMPKATPPIDAPDRPATSQPAAAAERGEDENDVPATPPVFFRLHPLSLLFRIIGDLRTLVVPLALLYFSKGEVQYWYLIFFVPSVFIGLIQYLTVRYHFTPTELIVRQGFLIKNERHVPFQRIQNIDLIQKPLHRIIKVAEVRVETAGGKAPEATFKVLSLSAVQSMRERVFDKRQAASAAASALAEPQSEQSAQPSAGSAPKERAPDGEVIVRVPTEDLVRLGLISNRAFAVIAAASGLSWEFGLERGIKRFEWVTPMIESLPPSAWVGLALLGVSLMLLFSVGWTVFRLHGFVLEKVGEDLRLHYGLMTRLSATIPRRRVQFVSVRQSWRHRLLGRVSVRVETAGGADGDGAQSSRHYFIPILPMERLSEVLDAILPEFNAKEASWQPLSSRAKRRARRRSFGMSTVMAAILGTLLWNFWEPRFCAVALFVYPLFWWWAGAAVDRARYARTPHGIAYSDGVFTRKTSVTIYEKIQAAVLSDSPFDRYHDMATVRVDTAGAGVAGHHIAVPFLDAEVAEALHQEIVQSTQESRFV